jgi:hypothetical protein
LREKAEIGRAGKIIQEKEKPISRDTFLTAFVYGKMI